MIDAAGWCNNCQLPRLIFVTSMLYDGALGGLAGADAKCSDLAAAVGLSSANTTWKAWLSDANTSAAGRMDTSFTGWYLLRRPPGYPVTPVAEGWTGLTSGTLMHAIDSDEYGLLEESTYFVWTNTDTGGVALDPVNNCSSWTANAVGPHVIPIGNAMLADTNWTDNGLLSCDVKLHLYCVEDSR
jgi:hypothetical protein